MKIAFLVTEFPSISQTFILNQITGLIKRGHDIHIFALSSNKSDKYHPDILKYNLLNKTTFFPKIPKNPIIRLVKGIFYFFSNIIIYPKQILRSLNFFRYGKLSYSLRLFYQILPFLTFGQFEIVHCHFGPMGIVGARCMSTGALSGKLIVAFHGYDLTSYLKTFGAHVYEDLFKMCDLCLPISDFWKHKLIALGCPEKKIRVHRMGVDIHHFLPKKNPAGNKNKIKILSVARLVEKKGIEYAIKALASVAKKSDKIEYNIIGDGPLKAELEELVNNLGIANHVIFKGWMNQTEIFRMLRNTDIFMAPSITSSNGDQEGIPVVLMEALMMELPAISTFHSGIPELIQDGISGFLVPEKDVDALAKKLLLFIQDNELRNKMGKTGRQFVEEHFNVDKLNDQLVDIYQELIDLHSSQI